MTSIHSTSTSIRNGRALMIPRIEVWKRAIQLRHHLSVAHFDWLCWWRRPAEYQYVLGKQLRLGPDDLNPLDVDFDQEWESADDSPYRGLPARDPAPAGPVRRALRL